MVLKTAPTERSLKIGEELRHLDLRKNDRVKSVLVKKRQRLQKRHQKSNAIASATVVVVAVAVVTEAQSIALRKPLRKEKRPKKLLVKYH